IEQATLESSHLRGAQNISKWLQKCLKEIDERVYNELKVKMRPHQVRKNKLSFITYPFVRNGNSNLISLKIYQSC
ncbi:MAG: hypothetical protein ACTSYC_12525, partial [Promethearchaeota archaeon]